MSKKEGIVTGVLTISLKHERANNTLVVHIDKARALRLHMKNAAHVTNPYVKVFIQSLSRDKSKRKTRVVRQNVTPVFAEDLRYVDVMSETEMLNAQLLFEVNSQNQVQHNDFLGQALVPVGPGLKYCKSHGFIELRLLQSQDLKEWSAGDTKTNSDGSSSAIGGETHTVSSPVGGTGGRASPLQSGERPRSSSGGAGAHATSLAGTHPPSSPISTDTTSRRAASLAQPTADGKQNDAKDSSDSNDDMLPSSTAGDSNDTHDTAGSSTDHAASICAAKIKSKFATLPAHMDLSKISARLLGQTSQPDASTMIDARPQSVDSPYRTVKSHSLSSAPSIDTIDASGQFSGGVPKSPLLSPMFRGVSDQEYLQTPLQTSMSTLEMAMNRPAVALSEGTSYVVHCQLESAVGMPTVRGGQLDDKYFRFSATVQGKKAKTSRVECSVINDSGVVVFENTKTTPATEAAHHVGRRSAAAPPLAADHTHQGKMEIPFRLATGKRVVPHIELRLSFGRGGLFNAKHLVGHASVSLSSLPIYLCQDSAEEEVAKQLPVDVYLQRGKLLPIGLSLRKDRLSDTVCHIRIKMWMTLLSQELDDGDDHGDDDEEADDDDDELLQDEIEDPPDNLPAELEWTLVDSTLPISLHKLNNLLFSPGSKFVDAFFAAKKYSDISVEDWSADGHRKVQYMIAKSALVKANMATEKQEYVTKCAGAYVVKVSSSTPDVPYGSTFEVMLQFKLVPEGSDHRHTKLTVTAEMKWFSNPYMKSMIRNGAKSGLMSTYALFLETLKPFCAAKKRKGAKGAAAAPGEGGSVDGAGSDVTQQAADSVASAAATDDETVLGKIMQLASTAKDAAQAVPAEMIVILLLLWVVWRLSWTIQALQDVQSDVRSLSDQIVNVANAIRSLQEGSEYTQVSHAE
eukprot:m.1100714 g.1100714  ORF g.1100714 m.1100714 type:complete len:912 (-) comp24319_c0_seq82:1051-3786(-)